MPLQDVAAAQLCYRLDGREDGPVLVFSNSLGTTHAMWDGQLEPLAERFRILRYDSRGHGKSSVPDGPYTIEELGKDLLQLLDSLGIERFRFCGLSMGGMVGQWIAVNEPGRVQQLVLCNTGARIGTPEVWNERIAAAEKDGMAALVDGVIGRWFTKAFREAAPDDVRRIREQFLSTEVKGYAACSAAVRDMDGRDQLKNIKAPTLVIAGSDDPSTPPALHEEIAKAVPGARLVTLKSAHLSNIEAKSAFDEALNGFLKD